MAIIISQNGKDAKKVDKSAFGKEDQLQKYIADNPEAIPLYDIEDDIHLLILAREFPTTSGPIDAVGIDRKGSIYIIETKLYNNPDKRTVVAQALDYGAALWKHSNDASEFLLRLEKDAKKLFGVSLDEKLITHFGLTDEALVALRDAIADNLSEGVLRFVILMDNLDAKLRDLILYVNQNSEFDIYAVELEYYRHQTYEIVIPRIFGAEVKKDLRTSVRGNKIEWTWELFEKRLAELGEDEVHVAKQIIDWAGSNGVEVSWATSQRGGFILCFYNEEDNRGFYPLSVTGEGVVEWNAPHQGDKSPKPFDSPAMRSEILQRLGSIPGATVDSKNVDGYTGLKLPLRLLAPEGARQIFFSVCLWIKETLENR